MAQTSPLPTSDDDARTRRFNRLCAAAALVWLAVTIPWGLVKRPTDSDFQQFYMAGVMLRAGEADELYPLPHAGSPDNPGMKAASDLRPRAAELYKQREVPDITHFMSPPPSALLYTPLAGLSYLRAEWVWVGLLTLSVWVVAVAAGRFHRLCAGGAVSRWEGVLVLLVVLSPMAVRAIRIRNNTPFIAVCVALATLALLRPGHLRGLGGAAAVVVGGLLKYATLFLLPLVVVMRRWQALLWFLVLSAAVSAAAWAVMGPEPYRTFVTDIAATLERPSRFPGNQTVAGLVARTIPTKPLPAHVTWALRGAMAGVLLCLLVPMLRLTDAHWRRPANVFAAAAALIAWVMAFGPVAWEHWPIFLVPSFGWLAWEARRSWPGRVFAPLAVLLMCAPLSIFTNPGFFQKPWVVPEPWNSSQLAGVLLTMLIGFVRLIRPQEPGGA